MPPASHINQKKRPEVQLTQEERWALADAKVKSKEMIKERKFMQREKAVQRKIAKEERKVQTLVRKYEGKKAATSKKPVAEQEDTKNEQIPAPAPIKNNENKETYISLLDSDTEEPSAPPAPSQPALRNEDDISTEDEDA